MILPWYYKLIAGLALSASLVGYGWISGARHVQKDWQSAVTAQAVADSERLAQQAKSTVKVVTEYVDRIVTVKSKVKTIIKEIPVYVTEKADAGCTITNGFIWLHNAAAHATLPVSPGDPDAAAVGITLSYVASTVAGNYGRCAENSEQLMALQEWVRTMGGDR